MRSSFRTRSRVLLPASIPWEVSLRWAQAFPGALLPGLAGLVAFASLRHTVGLAAVGEVSTAWVFGNLVASVLAAGPASVAARDLASGIEGKTAMYRWVLYRRMRWVVLPAGVLVLASWGSHSSVLEAMALGVAWIVPQALANFQATVVNAAGAHGRASYLLSARAVAAWVVFVGLSDRTTNLVTLVVAHAVVSFAAVWITGGLGAERCDYETLRRARRIGGPLARSTVASYGMAYADRLVVLGLSGANPAGVYSLGYQVGEGSVELITAPFTTVLAPRLLRQWHAGADGPTRARRTAVQASLLIAGIGVAVSVAVVVGAALGLTDVVAPFLAMAWIAPVVACAVAVQSVTRVNQVLLIAQERTGEISRAFWSAFGLGVVVVPALTILFGIRGTAAATFIVYAVLAVLIAIPAHRPLKGGDGARDGQGVRRVCIVQPLLADYNVPCYELVGADRRMALEVWAGVGSTGSQSSFRGRSDHFAYHVAAERRLGPFISQPRALRAAGSSRFDVLMLSWNARYLELLPAVVLGRLTGKRVLVWGHGFTKRRSRIRERMRLAVAALADGVLAYSAEEAEGIRGRTLTSVHVAENALDQAPILAAASEWRRQPGALERFWDEQGVGAVPQLLYISRLYREKRCELLLEAMDLLAQSGTTVELTIIGDGPAEAELRIDAERRGLGRLVRFLGPTHDEHAIAPWMMGAHACVFPGGVGIGIFHAFGFGVPVIAPDDDGGSPEAAALEDGFNGLSFEAGSAASLAHAIQRVIVPEARARLAAGAVATVGPGRYTVEEMAKGMIGALWGDAPEDGR